MNKKLIWGIVIVIVVVSGIVYFNSSVAKPVCWPYCENMTDQDREKIRESLNQESSNLKITSISRTSGTIGDVIKVRGSLLDVRGDQNLRIMNSKGENAQLTTEITRENGEVVMSFVLKEKECMEFGSDRGGQCIGEFMNITPGEYSIYVKSILENSESNKVKFIVINSEKITTANWKIYKFNGSSYIKSGPISFKYPSDWILDTTYNTTPKGVKDIASVTITSPDGIGQVAFSNGGNQNNLTCQTLEKMNSQESRGKIVCNMINGTPFYLTYTTNSELVEIYNTIINSIIK